MQTIYFRIKFIKVVSFVVISALHMEYRPSCSLNMDISPGTIRYRTTTIPNPVFFPTRKVPMFTLTRCFILANDFFKSETCQ